MSGSINKVMLIGRLGKDPEMRFTPSGKAVTNFTMATNEVWSDQNGEKQGIMPTSAAIRFTRSAMRASTASGP